MIDNQKVVAIIPARGGSKGVPRKNINDFCGKPLIAWTIEEALKCKYLDRLLVSTEDQEIATVAKEFGAEVPFLRPEQLARDDTPGVEPILHALDWLSEKEQYHPDYICTLQCTSPFRKDYQISEALEILVAEGHDSIIGVCASEVNPYWMKKIENGKLKNFMPTAINYTRRQDLPKVYRLNGAIYMARTAVLLKKRNWYTDHTVPYVMDKLSSMDIDDLVDFKVAEFLMKECLANEE
ncbi:MAG TPA: acylneuraminate cytidylyltransferase [Firmicutes bacterium]|nr:acylneuraminate cytidylyltransferase [Bacillota bacterium]